MSEEEKAILKDFVHNENTQYCYDWQGFDHKTILPIIEKSLNLIDKLQKENEQIKKCLDMKKIMFEDMPIGTNLILMYKGDFNRVWGSDYIEKEAYMKLQKENEIKDKVIDEMATHLSVVSLKYQYMTSEEIKEIIYKKVEEEND